MGLVAVLVIVGVGMLVACNDGVAVGTNVPGAMGGSVAAGVRWVLSGTMGVVPPPSVQAIVAKASRMIGSRML